MTDPTSTGDEGRTTDVVRRAPVNGPPGGTIAWPEHLRAWIAYARTYGTDQSAERIAERGGFGVSELVTQLGHMPRTWEPGSGTRFLAGVTFEPYKPPVATEGAERG